MLALAKKREPMKEQKETPDTMYGRLLEAVHISGYSFERVCAELEWMLDQDRWKIAGTGYSDINHFLDSIDLSQFKIDPLRRKKLVKKLTDIEATQRAAARMLGVTPLAVSRDLQPVTNVTELEKQEQEKQDVMDDAVTNVTEPPKSKNVHVAENTGENEWYTLPAYIEATGKLEEALAIGHEMTGQGYPRPREGARHHC